MEKVTPVFKKKKGVIKAKPQKEDKCEMVKQCRDPLYVGIDPSIKATGIVVLDKDANIIEQKLFSIKDDPFEKSLLKYEEEIKFIRNIISLQAVYLEGAAFQAKGQAVLQMGTLHFLTRLFLFKNDLNYKIIAPGTLKKFVTGNGHAKKELMLLKTFKKWGAEFEDNNICDAYGLARMALEGA